MPSVTKKHQSQVGVRLCAGCKGTPGITSQALREHCMHNRMGKHKSNSDAWRSGMQQGVGVGQISSRDKASDES